MQENKNEKSAPDNADNTNQNSDFVSVEQQREYERIIAEREKRDAEREKKADSYGIISAVLLVIGFWAMFFLKRDRCLYLDRVFCNRTCFCFIRICNKKNKAYQNVNDNNCRIYSIYDSYRGNRIYILVNNERLCPILINPKRKDFYEKSSTTQLRL